MIPVKLALRNFMSYRDNVPPLDFRGFHVACLSGDNGNGKSALLDAVTWVLWGQARAKSDDELIHLGQQEMSVEFEFLLGDDSYRVLRQRSKSRVLLRPGAEKDRPRRSGQTVLEFQIVTGDGFRPLTGNTIRETQRKIDELLRMDYETFINSAFLLQGRADEFTKKNPAARKEILAEILGLRYYDALEQRAREEAKERTLRVQQIDAAIEEDDQELARRPEYEAELRGLEETLRDIDREVSLAEANLGRLREQKRVLDLKAEQLGEILRRQQQAQLELKEASARADELEQRIAEHERILEGQEQIESAYQELLRLRQRNHALTEALGELTRLSERKAQLESRVRDARNELETQHRLLGAEVSRLQEKVGKQLAVREQQQRVAQRLREVREQEARVETTRQKLVELGRDIHLRESKGEQVFKEGKEIGEKLKLLEGTDVKCPLCEADLGREGKDRVREKWQGEIEARREAYRLNQVELKRLRAQEKELASQLAAQEANVRAERERLQRESAELDRELAEIESASEALAPALENLGLLAQQLTGQRYAKPEQEELRQLLFAIERLGYDQAEHQRVMARLQEIEPVEQEHRKLQEASTTLPRDRELLAQARQLVERRKATIVEESEQAERLAAEVEGEGTLLAEIGRAEGDVSLLRQRQAQGRQWLGNIQAKIEHCRQLEQKKIERQQERDRAAEEKGIYEELALAFGKKGIQALIIESVLPELEDEANRLLSRMTDNRMHIALESQRDTQKGETLETLNIRIADELGDRNYELFSGGEAFRVNFALRVALSKLLARRAGARLQTLVVDEGFGTQDNLGREKLVEAINAVQGDFEKILVITHIEELKDSFPVRIEVTKTAQGSMAQMVD